MREIPCFIQVRQIGHCLKADPAYGEDITKGLDIGMDEAKSVA